MKYVTDGMAAWHLVIADGLLAGFGRHFQGRFGLHQLAEAYRAERTREALIKD